MDRKARSDLHQRRSRITRRPGSTEAVEFFNVLTSAQLPETPKALLPEHRERLYPPTTTLSIFMRQTLEADASCQKAVNGWAAQRAADGLRACSVRTGGYCRARQRLPLEMVRALARNTGRLLSQKAHTHWLWRARAVKLVDGTGLSMPDTPENQAVYPQPSTQATGVGFPLARLVMVICLATGAALDAAIGPHLGKGSGELGLVRQVLGSLRPGDVIACRCPVLQLLPDRHADGRGCGRAVRAERLSHHRFSSRPVAGNARPHRALAQASEPAAVDGTRAVCERARRARVA